MIVIGECIHVISGEVKKAIEAKDKAPIQMLARRQVEKGANMLDLNIGPQRRAGPEIMTWMVQTVREVIDVPLSLDTTNAAAIEAGLRLEGKRALINSTDATPERLAAMMPLAAEHGASIIALTLAGGGLPSSADARLELALERILPAAAEHGVPSERIYFDPLVLTVNGNQAQVLQAVDSVRMFKQLTDPPPLTTCGLSNVSNGAPNELRPLINRVFLVMMLAAGLDSAIMDPLDAETMEMMRIIEVRDNSTPNGRLYLALYDCYAAGEEFDPSLGDPSDPEQRDILKTIEILENKAIYAHSYLHL